MFYCKNCDLKVADNLRLSNSRCPYCKKFMARATPEGIVLAKNRERFELSERLLKLPPEQRKDIIHQLEWEASDDMTKK